MANFIPPIPYKSKMLDDKGHITEAWSKFVRAIFERLGGSNPIDETTQTGNIPQDLANISRQIDFIKQGPVE